MEIGWLVPSAWVGLVAVAVPIAVHLLARRRRTPVVVASVRFLAASERAAPSRHRIDDAALLAVRAAIVVAAVGALAGPQVRSAAREAAWSRRTVRAIVVSGDAAALAAPDASADRVRTFQSRGDLRAGLGAAVAWLEAEAPGAREIVVAGALREGMLDARDIQRVPAHVGLRFLPDDGGTPGRTMRWTTLGAKGEREIVEVAAAERYTAARVVAREVPSDPAAVVAVSAPGTSQAVAEQAREAALGRGAVVPPDANRRVRLEWGARPQGSRPLPDIAWMRRAAELVPPAFDLSAEEGVLVARIAGDVEIEAATAAIRTVVDAVFHQDLDRLEPNAIAPAVLATWSRPPGPMPVGGRPADEGDRRWLWGGALALVALETWMRRRPRIAS
ncbi:MAG: BatA domain-containing protein [Acidobacteriota bacterium]